ncbi:MAG: orotidine-5'-phosphate decarboxylase [Dehalococcoidia bacterium]
MTAARASFSTRFDAAVQRNRSLLCVGLDPDPQRIPAGVSTREFLMGIVEATADVACCYKPNIAFFEPDLHDGVTLVRDLIEAIHARGLPVIVDAKRGDIGNTAAAYARALYNVLDADAATVSPYLGGDSLEPFLAYEDRTAFILCRTSNPGAHDLQDLRVGERQEPLYAYVARLANGWNANHNIGLVVGATYPREAQEIRAICPDMPILMPGVGAQAGDLEAAVTAGVDAAGGNLIVNASRGVLYPPPAPSSERPEWAEGARIAAIALRDAINAARGTPA